MGAFAVEPEVEVRLLKRGIHEPGVTVRSPIRVEPGSLVQFVVSNKGNIPFDLTLLYVDSRFGITSLFPETGEANRFLPSDTRSLPVIEIDGKTTGREHLVAIAVSGKGQQPISFSTLAQSTIEKYRGQGIDREATALGGLLERGLYGEGMTRSAGREVVSAFHVGAIPFDVVEGGAE